MVTHTENGYPEHTEQYEWKSASVTIAGTSADTDLTGVVGFTTLFDTVPRAHHVVIESSGTAYVTLNDSSNDIITISSTTPYEDHYCIVTAIYASTNNGAVTLTVKLR